MAKTPEQIRTELLVLRCQQGDRDALSELVAAWQERLWRHAYRTTGAEDAAWDAVQEAWTAIVRGIGRLTDAAAFPRWAFQIVTHKCADIARREQLDREATREMTQRATDEADPAPAVERAADLREALGRLPADRRALLSLYYVEGLAVAEIAQVLGVPEGTVKSRLHHARRTLKQMLEVDGDG